MRDAVADEEIKNEILRAEAIFQNLGFSAKPRFRYPYGEHDSRTDAVIASLGYTYIGWTLDSLGWKEGATIEGVVERIKRNVKSGAIILMHVGSPEDVVAFPIIVEWLRPTYRFVFVSGFR